MEIGAYVSRLTREEKAALVAGTDFMYTNPVARLEIPAIRMSDGPHGLRVQQHKGDNGTSRSEIATCFPTAATTACSWNPDNLYRMGRAMGKECHHYGINVVLGPAVNVKRNPLGGRGFEYFSEDPHLAGELGVAQVQGIQEEGVGVSVKHFALNSSENYRFMGDSVADERTMREIYLKPFEAIVRRAHPETLMCAYNKINGEYCAENRWLLTDLLRNEWGFDGLVMTDWGATHNRVRMLEAGLDLEMPGDTAICRKWIMDALESGELSEAVLDEAVKNVLTLVERHREDRHGEADFAAHNELALDIAKDSAVLLKNSGVLPLSEQEELFVCGELFERMRYQGSGSSMIHPAYLSTPKSAFDAHGVRYTYAKGYRESATARDDALIDEAVRACEGYANVLVFLGLTDYLESESFDRADMRLAENQLSLVEALVSAGRRVTVVLFGGSPMELPFADRVEAILNMYLPGQNGGEATYELLFGHASPAGRLAESWPTVYADVPSAPQFGTVKNEIYREGIFVGYRYYLTAKKPVRYPFGYGLTYTSFAYESMTLTERDGIFTVTADIVNTGSRAAAEVVQLYVGAPAVQVFAPTRELRGFCKVYLAPGERRTVEICVSKNDLRYWDTHEGRYVLEGGEYRFELCRDAETVCLSKAFMLSGESVGAPYSDRVMAIYREADVKQVSDAIFEEMSGKKIPSDPPLLPIHLESRLSDLKQTFMGRILYKTVMLVADIDMFRAKRMPEGVERDNKIKGAVFMRRILDTNSLVTMSMASCGALPYNIAQGFVHLANGKILRGLRAICSGIRAPKLPKHTTVRK